MIKNKAGTPGLRSQIQILLAGVILSLTASILVVVWLMGYYLYDEKIKDALRKADAALEQYFYIQDTAVLNGARVLAGDFGFKAAVASRDEPTIISMLENHSDRIGADVLLLSELDGKHIATSHHVLSSLPKEVLGHLANSAIERQFVQVKDSVYRIYKVEVRAPRPISLLMVGLEYDREALNRLSVLTGVDVTLYASGAPPKVISSNISLENAAKREILTSDEPFWSILSFAPAAKEFGVTSANNTVRFYYHLNADEIQSEVKAAALIIGLISAITALMAMLFGGVLSARLLDPKSSIHRDLIREANEDPLTGVMSRNAVDERLSSEIRRAVIAGGEYCVGFIELDNTEAIASQGEKVLNNALIVIANRFSASVREFDVFGRHVGARFVVGLPLTADVAKLVLERLRTSIFNKPLLIDDKEQRISVSIGACMVARTDVESGFELESIFDRANEALVKVQREGSNKVLLNEGYQYIGNQPGRNLRSGESS